MSYLDKNLIDIEEEINLVFENVYKKIKKIEDIAEGYQNLNTNELIAESIKSFKSFNIKRAPVDTVGAFCCGGYLKIK